MDVDGLDVIKAQLFRAVHELNQRGLLHSAKWASELLVSIKTKNQPSFSPQDVFDYDCTYLLAKNYFDLKEYRRAAHTLEKSNDNKSFFLRNYALFLAGEKGKSEERMEVGERCPVKNRLLVKIYEELQSAYNMNRLDGYGLYLYGIILREMSYVAKARDVLVESIVKKPWNWSAWLDLAQLCPDRDVLRHLKLPSNEWVYPFFLAHLYLELQHNEESIKIYNSLSEQYPDNNYLLAQTAVASYNMQDYVQSEQSFDKLAINDPYRITNMDTYSNILYITQKQSKLSSLAYKASSTDKYTPEANAIIGNYFSSKNDHQKAIKYFKRALQLNPKYLSAWTLMGHEYIELKNEKAAIPAYRKAVDINPRDYRAWYGLGISYEIGGLPLYALYYYGRACAIRSYDPTMWIAMAECYETNENFDDAIKCLERAIHNNDREGVALFRLAQIFKQRGPEHTETAAFYFKKYLDAREGVPPDSDQMDALEFLAHHCKDNGLFDDAVRYCNRLLEPNNYPSQTESAKALLREINSQKVFDQGSLTLL